MRNDQNQNNEKKLGQASMDGGILAEVRAKSERAKRAIESPSPVSNGDRIGA
jgi:hypothetical protein